MPADIIPAGGFDERTIHDLFGDSQTIGDGTHRYYRDRTGDIQIGYTDQLSLFRALAEGWIPLHDYGRFNIYAYTNEHPFENLLMRGGAKEMTRHQLHELGMHREAPLLPTCGQIISETHRRHSSGCWRGAEQVVFTQLLDEDREVRPECPFCSADFPNREAMEQHSRVMHSDRLSAHQFQTAVVEAMHSVAAPAAAPVTESRNPYVCGYCGLSFTAPPALLAHVKTHKTANVAAGAEEPES